MHKSHQEIYLDFREEDRPPLRAIIKEFCKRFGCKEKVRSSVLYNKSGLQLFDKDIDFIKADDVLYIALDGKQNEIDWEGGRGAGGAPLAATSMSYFYVFAFVELQGRPSITARFSTITKCTRKSARAGSATCTSPRTK